MNKKLMPKLMPKLMSKMMKKIMILQRKKMNKMLQKNELLKKLNKNLDQKAKRIKKNNLQSNEYYKIQRIIMTKQNTFHQKNQKNFQIQMLIQGLTVEQQISYNYLKNTDKSVNKMDNIVKLKELK